jgi:sensor histidine kinase YesM
MSINYRNTFLFFLFFACTYSLSAQDPSYRILGETFFEDKDIYSILEDREHNIWVGTDAGLVRYDGSTFKTWEGEGLKNRDVFNLLMDNNGVVYYYNFSGQIVQVLKDSLVVFFQVPDDLASIGYAFHFDNNNNLIVFAEKLIKVNQDKSIEIIYDSEEIYPTNIVKKEDGTLTFILTEKKSKIGEWRADTFVKKDYPSELLGDYIDLQIFSTQGQEIIVSRKTKEVLKKTNIGWSLVPLPNAESYCTAPLNFFFFNKKQLWFSCNSMGAHLFDLEGKAFFPNKVLDDYIISEAIQDQDGNIWGGTFKKGLLFIPSLEVVDFSRHPIFQKHKISCIEKGPKGRVYVAARNGTIYAIDSKDSVSILIENQLHDLEELFFYEKANLLYWDEGTLDLNTNQFKKQEGLTIKDIEQFNEDDLLIGTMSGITMFSKNEQEQLATARLQKHAPLSLLDVTKGGSANLRLNRSNSIHYDSLSDIIWAGTSDNLILLKANGDSSKLSYQGKSIAARSISQYKETIFVAAQSGILVLEGQEVKRRISTENGLLSNKVTKIQCREHFLYISTDKAFQRLNLLTDEWQTFSELDGFLKANIVDFLVEEPFVWLVTGKGLQRFNLTILEQKNVAPKLVFSSVLVNEQLVEWNKKGVFDYDQNKVTIEFFAKSYSNENTFHYEYRLKGMDDEWQVLNYHENSVRYNALAAGTYVFEIKLIDIEGNVSPAIEYTFSIAIPYWQTWWFFVLCILGVAALVALFFLIRIRILQQQNQLLLEKKAMEKELIESRQTALRSQMNPHFLFNALNSIQEMIMVNEKKLAGQYLGKFADLMRMYLNQSRKNTIALSEELEALNLYLDLEKVRFEDSLRIHYEVAPDLDVDNIIIPPMLIQPYVENAFKHGLLHKQYNRLLKIKFDYQSSPKRLLCTIEDNGVGREKSAEINLQRALYHESFSSSATQKRLELLNYNKKHPIVVVLEDLKDESSGDAIGTRVVLQIPLDWNTTVEEEEL